MTLSELINQLGEQGVSIEFRKSTSPNGRDLIVDMREVFGAPESKRQVCVVYQKEIDDSVADRIFEWLKPHGAFNPIRRYVVKQVEPRS